jgi:DNA-binding NarL/FixJ family response regulator
MKRTRILLADDHKMFLHSLKLLLEREFEIVGMVEDGRSLVTAAEKLAPDVILVDVSMPLLNGIEAARQIKRVDSHVKVIFLTMHAEVTYAIRAFEAGASGYVLKHASPSELFTAIRGALKGRTYVSPMIAGELVQSYRSGSQLDESHWLTKRQREILQLLAEGYTAKEIAAILSVSTRTIESHKYSLMSKLHLKTSSALVQYAIRHGITATEGLDKGLFTETK